MIVRTINQIEGTERDIQFAQGQSLRIILDKDSMGFSVHKTIIPAGQVGIWHYKNHLEACYCIQGEAVLTNLETNEVFRISPDTLYALDKHDKHKFESITDVVLISIFNPPVKGGEIHKEDGSYEI
jgi:L-ectoine synthase